METQTLRIRGAAPSNRKAIAEIYAENFHGMEDTGMIRQYVTSILVARPLMRTYVAEKGDEVMGYIVWLEEGGLRSPAVVELRQVAVAKKFQGEGIGTGLITESFRSLEAAILPRVVGRVRVATGMENERGQHIYRKIFQESFGFARLQKLVVRDWFGPGRDELELFFGDRI